MAVSEPIEPTGSAPVRAIGPTITRSSSLVYPNSRWWVTTLACWGVSMVRGGRSSRSTWSLLQPLAVGVLGGQPRLDLVVVDDPTLRRVDEEHPAGLEPALAHDRGRVEVEHADLAGEHDEPVVGDPVAGRPQPVAVEDRADDRAVGEGDGRRAVPGLHQRGVEPVEGPTRRVHRGVVLPRLGDHHQHGVGQRAPAEVEQLEHLVEGGRVARAGGADREDAAEVAGDQVRPQERLAGAHPVAVARDGVDLAVVGEVAVRVGERPARERVGREPRVDERQADSRSAGRSGRGRSTRELVGGQHPLVDERPRRQRREVEPVDRVLDPLAHARRPGDRGPGRPARHVSAAGATKTCSIRGCARRAVSPSVAVVERDLAPAEDVEALLVRRCAATWARALAASSPSWGRKAIPVA